MNKSLDEAEFDHARAVHEMFSGIAPRYDFLNHFLSANVDKRWRRRVSRQIRDVLDRPHARVLDVACGTGDLSFELRRGASAAIIGTDFCRPMLALATEKALGHQTGVAFVESDALRLPFENALFDAVTIAFGLRNLSDVSRGIDEFHRVLKPGGTLVVLEFSTPQVPGLRALFDFYFTRVLPRIGGFVSGSRGAYEYLPRSVRKFPDQRLLTSMIEKAGFGDVEYSNLTGGIAAIHTGAKLEL